MTITIETSEDATTVWNHLQAKKDEKGVTTLRLDCLKPIGGLNAVQTLKAWKELEDKGLSWVDALDKTISVRIK